MIWPSCFQAGVRVDNGLANSIGNALEIGRYPVIQFIPIL
jgi:hypothetical protein